MKILLVGEYNRAHKFIKDGLIHLGHDALVVGLTDGFKKVDIDLEIKHHYKKRFLKKWRTLLFKLFKIDIHDLSVKKQLHSLESKLSGYDIIQLCLNKNTIYNDFICKWETYTAELKRLNCTFMNNNTVSKVLPLNSIISETYIFVHSQIWNKTDTTKTVKDFFLNIAHTYVFTGDIFN